MEERGIKRPFGDPDIVEEVLADLRAMWDLEHPAYMRLYEAGLRILEHHWWEGPRPGVESSEDGDGSSEEDVQLSGGQQGRGPDGSEFQGQIAPTQLEAIRDVEALPWCQDVEFEDQIKGLSSQLTKLSCEIKSVRSASDLSSITKRAQDLEARFPPIPDPGSRCGSTPEIRQCCEAFRIQLAKGFLGTQTIEALDSLLLAIEHARVFQCQLEQIAAELRKGLDFPLTEETEPVTCINFGAVLEDLQKGIESLKLQFSKCQAEAQSRLDALEALPLKAEQLEKVDLLRKSFNSGVPIRQLIENIAELEAVLAESPGGLSLAQVAACLLEEGFQGPNLIRLGRAILDGGDPSLAMLYFRILQEHPIEDSGLDDFSSFVDSLLLSLVAQGGPKVWLDHLRDQPWLQALTLADLRDEKVAAATAAILLAAEHRCRGSFSHLWNGLRCPQVLSVFPTIGRIAEAVTRQQEWAWFDPKSAERLAMSDQKLEASSTQVLIEIHRDHKQFREFCKEAQMDLRRAWNDVREGRSPSLDPRALCEAFAAEAKGAASETFLCKKFNGLVSDYFQALEEHLHLVRVHHEAPSLQVRQEDFSAEREILSNGNEALQRLWRAAEEALLGEGEILLPDREAPPSVPVALASPSFARLLPEVIGRFNADPSAGFLQGHFQTLVERLATPLDPHVALTILVSSRSLHQAWELRASDGLEALVPSPEELADRLSSELHAYPALAFRQDLQVAIREGRFAWVEGQIMMAVDMIERERISRSAQINRSLDDVKRLLQSLEDQANVSDASESWKDQTQEALGGLLNRVQRALRPQQTLDEKQQTLDGLHKILEYVKDHVAYRAENFDLLRFPAREDEVPAPERLTPWAGDPERALIWEAMAILGEQSDLKIVRRHLESFLLGFAKATKMYCNPSDRCQVVQMVGFPFVHLRTSFHKSGCEAFNKPLHLFLLPGPNPNRSQFEQVRQTAEKGRQQAITLLLLPGTTKDAQRIIEREEKNGLLVIMDRPLLEQALAVEFAHKPLRQLLRRRISLEDASPFLSTGNLDKDAHLYVPIGKIEGKILNGHSWVVLGGRRSGKSTLLHAVKKTLLNKRVPYRCAFVSLESIPEKLAQGGDPDLLVALEIARQFGWDYPAEAGDLAEFERLLRDQCRMTKTCVVLDELDSYIQWHGSRQQYRFPVIRCLRSVSQEFRSSSDNLVCLFAGFKDLMRAFKHPIPSDTSYPWGNWLREVCMPRMDINETKELIDQGFKEILGLEVDAEVPNRIYRYTAGHPAFVQELCDGVLARLERQGRASDLVRVTSDEVDRTYYHFVNTTEERSFIRYVQRTLDLNLSNLDKVVAYIFAIFLIGQKENYEAPKSKDEILEAVEYWFQSYSGRVPPPEKIEAALENLEMTGMLTPVDQGGAFRMTFHSFVEILRRLEAADKDTIWRLIREMED